jgi:hypothetical protein
MFGVANDPVPDELHIGLLALAFIVPVNVATSVAQMLTSAPALTVAAPLMVIKICDVAATHGPAPSGSSVVNVSVTFPVLISVVPGV